MKIRSFHIREPDSKEIPVVVSIPHCGIYVPEAIRAKFASASVARLPMTEWYLHHLCDFLPGAGITTIYGTYNRSVADIDSDAGSVHSSTPDVPCFIPLQTDEGETIYDEIPTPEDIQARRDLVYAPYHARLSELLQSRITRYGSVVLLDLHSFPSRTAAACDPSPAQVYLSDDDGRTNPGWLTSVIQYGFSHAGLSVSNNGPIHGKCIVPRYGADPRIAALYVGLRQDLYLDERYPDRTPTHAGFRAFKTLLSDVCTGLAGEVNEGSLRMNRRERNTMVLSI